MLIQWVRQKQGCQSYIGAESKIYQIINSSFANFRVYPTVIIVQLGYKSGHIAVFLHF